MTSYNCTEGKCVEAGDGVYESKMKCEAGCIFENNVCETFKKGFFSIDLCASKNIELLLIFLYIWVCIFLL